MKLLLIFLGGGLGSMLRWIISVMYTKDHSSIPYGTLIANCIGAFALGGLVVLYQKGYFQQNFYLFAATGFCGGLTTFSTFMFELMDMSVNHQMNFFFYYLIGSILLGLLFAYLGYYLMHQVPVA